MSDLLSRLQLHRDFRSAVRAFFDGQGFLEVETPLLNTHGAVEAHLDSFAVRRSGIRKSPEAPESVDARAGFLITSPEYNMKILLTELRRSIYQIAHCFREGDTGRIHAEEFLMLEWYLVGADEFALMEQCETLFRRLGTDFAVPEIAAQLPAGAFPRRRVLDLLIEFADVHSFAREDLVRCVTKHRLAGDGRALAGWLYDEIFFTVFLNLVEPHLGQGVPEFVFDYPPELAALARVEDGRARRFEIYWNGLELANGYFELTDPVELRRRFDCENDLRRKLGKPAMEPDRGLLAALEERGLPECSGIALGLDRLLAAFRSAAAIKDVGNFI